MKDMDGLICQSSDLIVKCSGDLKPRIAVVLGSGLGDVADLLEERANVPYGDLPGFPPAGVEGHEGSLRIGTVGGTPVIFLKGRQHLYEGKGADATKIVIRSLKKAGVTTLFLTNAAGSLLRENDAGSVVAITDHINFTGLNPLSGPNDAQWGPRFPPMENAWDADLLAQLVKAANDAEIKLGQGVYAAFLGPNFETPAEIRMAKIVGADLVGMSTVAENIIARHCGLKCIGCSAVTNLGAGMGDTALSHEQTLEFAAVAGKNMAKLMAAFLPGFMG